MVMLQSHHWLCVECAIHHERYVHEEQHLYTYLAQTSNNRVIATHDLYSGTPERQQGRGGAEKTLREMQTYEKQKNRYQLSSP